MAIKKSAEETIIRKGNRDEWLAKSKRALEKKRFKSIKTSENPHMIKANYRKFTIWGDIDIMLLPDGDSTKIIVKSNAAVDNVYSLFRYITLRPPARIIINKFKAGL